MTQVYAIRYLAHGINRLAATAEVKRITRTDRERAKLNVRSFRIGRLEISSFRAFGMNNVSVKWSGRTMAKLATRTRTGRA